MADGPGFDVDAAHKFFSADCFNKTWELMDKADRTAEEDEQMLRLSLASHWHWTQRPDCAPTHMSVAYWQTSRVCAILGQAEDARRYAHLCLAASKGDDVLPFYLGYAYEALARAESVAGNAEKAQEHVREARRVAETMPDPEAKKQLLTDLETIK